MQLGKLLEFRKDLYFEGAVQADWFYAPDKSSMVAENFVFHGNKYFGIEEQGTGSRKRIDTISLVEELLAKLNDERSNALSLAIADYGTGKSHLAVTLAQLFSGSAYMPTSFDKIIHNIGSIDRGASERIEELSKGRNFVMVINGMRDFNLHAEVLKAAQKSLKLYGLPDDNLRKLNRAIETAERFFVRNEQSSLKLFETAALRRGVNVSGESLVRYISENLLVDEVAFEIVNDVYQEINGQEIRWDEGLSASSILEMLVAEYCGMNGLFDHVVLLFDEFGRYLEYTAGVNAARSGESGLQQIFELTQKTQNIEGYLHVINFIQRDIKQYLETVDQTKNVSRYIGRFDQSEKYYISSNLETVFANLIQRKDNEAFNNKIVKWQKSNEEQWMRMFENLNKWLITKGIWKEYKLFRNVIVEGIYPLHPISTYMLTNLSDYLQNRSSLTLISNHIKQNESVQINDIPFMIIPEYLLSGDLYTEMLAAEQEGRQKTQQCIRFGNVLSKYQDKLSENSLKVLRANLILRILRFRTTDYNDAICALSLCSGLSEIEVKEELCWLEKEYAVLEFDDHAAVFDFAEESNGAHDFKIIKKRLMANASIDKSIISSIKIQELAGVIEAQPTNFGVQHKITTSEWQFVQEMYPIEAFTTDRLASYINEWKAATSSTVAKGKLIWLYSNRETNPSCIQKVQDMIVELREKPIVIMLMNDSNNRMFDRLVEYSVLDNMEHSIRTKYERHYNENFTRAESNLKDEVDVLKKERLIIRDGEIEKLSLRMPIYLTRVFEEIYSNAIPFFFDGFVTNKNNISNKAAGFYCSFLKMLLSNAVNEATIHNFVIDMRNRVESLFAVTSLTSWKCINEKCRLISPEEKNAKFVYEQIVNKINSEKQVACKDIYSIYCKPPFGMSEDVITLMIAVVCGNLSYCLRMHYHKQMNINAWKDLIITNNDRKVDLRIIKESAIILVDAGAVTGKYMRFFENIKNNRSIMMVNRLATQLEEMVLVDEVPEDLEQSFLLAQRILDSGIKARNDWNSAIEKVDEKFEAAVETSNLYNAIIALENLNGIPFSSIFDDNGYEYDEELQQKVKNKKSEITNFIESIIDFYISNMYCKSVEGINTFRNHNSKVEQKLLDLGFVNFADLIRKKKEQELSNVEEIRSRQELKIDYDKFMEKSKLDKSTSHITICSLLKEALLLQERVIKYKNTLGKDSNLLVNNLLNRVEILSKHKDRTNQDMADIWDDLYEISSSEDVEDILERIALVLQKGISSADQVDFYDLQKSLGGLLEDINKIKAVTDSRARFEELSNEVKSKYLDTDVDFEVLPIIESVIGEIAELMDIKEEAWKKSNLSLGDKSRSGVHNFKEKTKFLPEFLSPGTITEFKLLSNEAELIISDGKIEDVLYYFGKLDSSEKEKCIKKLLNT